MWLAYERKNGGAVIRRCYDYGSAAELPDSIEGSPVTELAPYAFSDHMDWQELERDLSQGSLRLWNTESEPFPALPKAASHRSPAQAPVGSSYPSALAGAELPPALAGAGLTAVCLPASLRKIGAYAFYNCSRLRELSFCGGLTDLGAGLFTGCHGIREIDLTPDEEGRSCLREILIEVPEKLTVHLRTGGGARLVFPEYFEESVENTPARILVIHTHGSGMNYRNCFYDRRFDFRAYDACFYRARAEEDPDTVLEMALGRLLYPEQLSDSGRAEYESWLLEHGRQAVVKAAADRDMDVLEYLTERILTEKLLEEGVSLAASMDFPEGVSYLMDALHRRRGERTGKAASGGKNDGLRKRFEL